MHHIYSMVDLSRLYCLASCFGFCDALHRLAGKNFREAVCLSCLCVASIGFPLLDFPLALCHNSARLHVEKALTPNIRTFQIQPFESVMRCFQELNRCLERIVTWPREFGYAIMNGQASCPYP